MSSSGNHLSSPKTYVLMSSDKETFEVEETVAVQSQTIKRMVEDDCFNPVIPLPNVSSKILSKVIEYCKRHVAAEDGLKAFDAEFVEVDQKTLIDLLLAANYLGMNDLIDLASKAVSEMLKDKSLEQIRGIFNIKNDFTAEEEAEIRRDNAWAFE